MDQQGEASDNEHNAQVLAAKQIKTPTGQDGSTAQKPRRERKDVNERIADYTKWLMIGTAILSVSTIALAGITAGLWSYAAEQAHDMKDSIKASRDANQIATTALSSDRAWVGPSGANAQTPVQAETPIKFSVTYKNTGRSPARSMRYTAKYLFYPLGVEKDLVPPAEARENFRSCFNTAVGNSGLVVYPTADQASYTINGQVNGDKVPKSFIESKLIIMIQGCMTYETNDVVRHSAFCFYGKNEQQSSNGLSFCEFGNDAN